MRKELVNGKLAWDKLALELVEAVGNGEIWSFYQPLLWNWVFHKLEECLDKAGLLF